MKIFNEHFNEDNRTNHPRLKHTITAVSMIVISAAFSIWLLICALA